MQQIKASVTVKGVLGGDATVKGTENVSS